MLLSRDNGWVNGILRCVLMDNTSSTGGALVGLTSASTGLLISTIADVEATATAYSAAGSTIDTIATLGTYAAPTTGHCRFKEVDSTNHPGLYELQFVNTRFAVSNASFLIVTISASGSHCSPQSFLIDLDSQVDVVAYAGATGSATGGVPQVNATQFGGSASALTLLLLELLGRRIGTVTSVSFTPTTTQFECSDITDADTSPVYISRGILITSGTQAGSINVVTTDQVGTAGRRFTTPALPAALANGDTILIL